jgi:hypothetical protein
MRRLQPPLEIQSALLPLLPISDAGEELQKNPSEGNHAATTPQFGANHRSGPLTKPGEVQALCYQFFQPDQSSTSKRGSYL